jgi:helix-turn-helix protein
VSSVLEEPGADWTIERLSRQVAMSRATFLRRFVRETGMTVGAFLTRARMMAAAQLLSTSDATVALSPTGSATSRNRRSPVRSAVHRFCIGCRVGGERFNLQPSCLDSAAPTRAAVRPDRSHASSPGRPSRCSSPLPAPARSSK